VSSPRARWRLSIYSAGPTNNLIRINNAVARLYNHDVNFSLCFLFW
jgi:hypothetical protein